MDQNVTRQLQRHIQVIEQAVIPMNTAVATCARRMCAALRGGGKIIIMGNGGSAADAQHFAAELVGRFLRNRAAMAAIALTTDTSILTAVANDFGYDEVFRRQVEALAAPQDVVVGISTSGNSPNVIAACALAAELGCCTVALTGRDGGELARRVDVPLTVAVEDTPRIQEAHLTIIHILCDLIETELYGEK